MLMRPSPTRTTSRCMGLVTLLRPRLQARLAVLVLRALVLLVPRSHLVRQAQARAVRRVRALRVRVLHRGRAQARQAPALADQALAPRLRAPADLQAVQAHRRLRALRPRLALRRVRQARLRVRAVRLRAALAAQVHLHRRLARAQARLAHRR